MIKKTGIVLFFLLIFISLLFLTRFTWLPSIGTFLLVPDHVEKADAIVPLSGDTYFRYREAAKLYEAGYASEIIVPILPELNEERDKALSFFYEVLDIPKMSETDFALKSLEHFGVPRTAVSLTGGSVTSTYEEALEIKKTIIEKNLDSFILVTSTYHMKRALMLFHFVFRDSNVVIYNKTAENEFFDPHEWWKREIDVKRVTLEYFSCLHNVLYHFMLKRGRTEFDAP